MPSGIRKALNASVAFLIAMPSSVAPQLQQRANFFNSQSRRGQFMNCPYFFRAQAGQGTLVGKPLSPNTPRHFLSALPSSAPLPTFLVTFGGASQALRRKNTNGPTATISMSTKAKG